MPLLKPLDTAHGYVKAGFYGEEKSGKTFTSVELALFTYQYFKHTGPIAYWDSEGGSTYRAKRIREVAELVGVRGRSLDELIAVIKECIDAGIKVLIVDSISDALEEARDAYQRKIGRNLEMRDYGVADKRMRVFCDLFLNSPIHIFVCGKQGSVYEKTDGKKMEKTGNKLKGGPFAYLARLLVEMEKVKNGNGAIQHRANIAGDCFDALKAGATLINPKASDFEAHLACLEPGKLASVDLSKSTNFDNEEDLEERKALIDEIKEQCDLRWPTPAKSKGKPEALTACFGSDSASRIVKESTIDQLRDGLAKLREMPV